MPLPDNWQINLNRKYCPPLIILLFLAFVCLEYLLCSPLLSSVYSDLSGQLLEKARSAGQNILASQALFYRDALRQLRLAIKANRRDAQLYYKYARIISEIAENNKISNAVGGIDIGARLEGKEGLYSLAMTYCKRAVFKEPANAAYHKELGAIYDRLSDHGQAEREFENALLLDPQNAALHVFLLEYFLSKGEEEKFQRYLKGTLELYYSCRGKDGVLAKTIEDFLRKINRQDLIEGGRAGVTQPLQRCREIGEGRAG